MIARELRTYTHRGWRVALTGIWETVHARAGTATLRGNPSEKENTEFIEAYKRTQPEAYSKSAPKWFHKNSGMVLIEITPRRIAGYKSVDTPMEEWEKGKILSYFELLNVEKKTAYKLDGLGIYEEPEYWE